MVWYSQVDVLTVYPWERGIKMDRLSKRALQKKGQKEDNKILGKLTRHFLIYH